MADQELVDALADCLDALRRGEADLRACLERHPAYWAELEPLLELAQRIPRLPREITPSAPFRERTRRRLLGRPTDPSPPADTEWSGAGSPST